MKHKMRTLQGQYKSVLKHNAELIRALEKAEKHATDLATQYRAAIKKAYTVSHAPEPDIGRMLMIRVCVDYLGSAKSREDMLNYLIEDIAHKAGWILSKHRDIPFKHSLT